MDARQEKGYSVYYQALEDNAKRRYREKLTILGDIEDPYVAISGTAGSRG
jgi:L-ribulose-5-phosphate 3-epimerase UlaE